jgi:FkbH-like protein
VLVDWERFVRLLGEDGSMDYRFWYMSKAPFKKDFLDLYARELVKIARALKGKSKKCLILDCDNTLWGGVIGEDGLQGVKLDRHSYPGNTFYQFQRSILRLHERGILIALCSKNNEQDVWEALDSHPDCLLKREHLAAWRVNWQDKASNIKALAAELNLGLDSFVFVDDNPVECGLIRDLVPDVTTLQVPDKLYSYPSLLERDGLFDTLMLSAEDLQRSRMYHDEANRRYEQAKYETLDQYLGSLGLSIVVRRVNAVEVLRIAQLTQKTNQFNLTTRRYSEAQIAAFADDPAYAVFSLSVRDKFGDSGLTGVLIARNDAGTGVIDTFLMSCRVLGRNIEVAFLLKSMEIIERGWHIKAWQAEYLPTQKNQQVAGFWSSLGFKEIGVHDGRRLYEFENGWTRPEKIAYIAVQEE